MNGLAWVGQLQTVHPSEIPQRIKDVQDRLHKSIVRQWRTAITGDPERLDFSYRTDNSCGQK